MAAYLARFNYEIVKQSALQRDIPRPHNVVPPTGRKTNG